MTSFLFLFFPFLLFALEGIHYSSQELSGSQVHILEVNPSLHKIELVKALDNGIGRESVLSIAQRTGAIASVSGGFFTVGSTFDGRACGTLKIHEWISLPTKLRGCIGWSSHLAPKVDLLPVSLETSCGHINGFNRPRQHGEAILYTPAYHRTTLTSPDGEELLIINDTVEAVFQRGSSPIPQDGTILSIHQDNPLFCILQEGTPFSYRIDTPSEWQPFDYLVGGAPLLIRNKTIITDFSAEQILEPFLIEKHARTAVGITEEGNWLFVVVDHNLFSKGMTVNELASLMLQLGAVDALNLGGGKGSTLVFENEVKNLPVGDEQDRPRRVSDAIIIRGFAP